MVTIKRDLDWMDHPGECQAFQARGFQPCTCPPADQAKERLAAETQGTVRLADKLGFRPVGDGSRLLFDRCCPTPRMGIMHAEWTSLGTVKRMRCELFCQACGKTLGKFTWHEERS